MALTPDDVVNYPLKQSMRGYSIQQVDELLDQVADELERLHRELDDAHRRLADAERKAETLDETESTLRRTLVTAQRAAEETIEEARRRAEEMVEEAEREAQTARQRALEEARHQEDELRGRHEGLRRTIERLEEYASAYRDNLRDLARTHLERLEDLDVRPAGDPPSTVPSPATGGAAGEGDRNDEEAVATGDVGEVEDEAGQVDEGADPGAGAPPADPSEREPRTPRDDAAPGDPRAAFDDEIFDRSDRGGRP